MAVSTAPTIAATGLPPWPRSCRRRPTRSACLRVSSRCFSSAGAVGPARRHRDLRLQHAHERMLAGVGLVEVLHDLLLLLLLLGLTHGAVLQSVVRAEGGDYGAVVGGVGLAAAGLGEAAADHVADGEERDEQPRLLGAEPAGVGLIDDAGGDQHADDGRHVGEELGRLERRLRLREATAGGVSVRWLARSLSGCGCGGRWWRSCEDSRNCGWGRTNRYVRDRNGLRSRIQRRMRERGEMLLRSLPGSTQALLASNTRSIA